MNIIWINLKVGELLVCKNKIILTTLFEEFRMYREYLVPLPTDVTGVTDMTDVAEVLGTNVQLAMYYYTL